MPILGALLLALGVSGEVAGQALAEPVLEGHVFAGDTAMSSGTVILHHIHDGDQGDVDSLAIGADGAFSFPLPNVPDPERNDVFLASIRHHGVLYFGPTITAAVQLDSIYEIHAYDTLVAPVEGMPLTVQSRSVFFEPDTDGWRVTDLFQLRNDETRTIVARSGGAAWRYPLPSEAEEVEAGDGELSIDAAAYEGGELVVRAALPPGERLFFVRYRVAEPTLAIPNRGATETFDVLIREPAPPLEVEGLELTDRIELEAGSTYLRFSGADVTLPSVRIVATEEPQPLPVAWVAVILTLILTASGAVLLRPPPGEVAGAAAAPDRHALLVEVARLDEEFESRDQSQAESRAYRRRRAELIERIRSGR